MNFINKVFHADCRDLLPLLPDESIDAVISDPMYGVSKKPTRCTYDWGADPVRGDPDEWWAYHEPVYRECRRVLRPGGAFAWAMGCKFRERFPEWFGNVRIWSFTRFQFVGMNAFGHIWIVQTREQKRIRFPDKDSLVLLRTKPSLLKLHPCPKAIEEMTFLIEALTRPGEIILDPFCGLGSTLCAAKKLSRRFLGCDLSEKYSRIAVQRLMIE